MLTNEQVEKLVKKLGVSNETSIEDENYKKIKEVYNYALSMTNKDTHQGAEALLHNLNSLQSRSGQQLPFSSINYGTCTSAEGRMVTNAILDATLDGTGPLHKTPIFPCGIFQFDKDVNGYAGTPNYDLFLKALYCTTKRFYPNYTNVNWSIDTAGRMKDVAHKREVIASLSKNRLDKLKNWVKENKEEARRYKMVIDENDELIIDEKIIDPVEIMSTMGCIDAKETITIRQNGKVETLTIGEFYERLAKNNNAES